MKQLINKKRAKKAGLYFSGTINEENLTDVMANLNMPGHMDLMEGKDAGRYLMSLLPGEAKNAYEINNSNTTKEILLPALGVAAVVSFISTIVIMRAFAKYTTWAFVLTMGVSVIIACSCGLLIKLFLEKIMEEKREYVQNIKRIVLRGKFLYPSLQINQEEKKVDLDICDLHIKNIPLKDFRENEHLFGGLPLVVVIDTCEEGPIPVHIFKHRV